MLILQIIKGNINWVSFNVGSTVQLLVCKSVESNSFLLGVLLSWSNKNKNVVFYQYTTQQEGFMAERLMVNGLVMVTDL